MNKDILINSGWITETELANLININVKSCIEKCKCPKQEVL